MMVRKGNDFAFFAGRADENNLDSGGDSLVILTPEERTALMREIQEKVDVLEESELQNLYTILKRFEILDE